MASIAIMIGGAVLNATAFIGGNYLARALGGGVKAALEEKALEDYQAAYAKYTCDKTELLDWITTNAQTKEQAKQAFTDTDYAFKLYNQVHPDERMAPPKEPKFSDFYQPSEQQKKGEFAFVGVGALALTYAAFRFHLTFLRLTFMDAKLAKIYYGPGGYWKGIAAIKELAEAAEVPEKTAKKCLIRQALWQIYLPPPKRIPPSKFDVSMPNKVHQADLLFLPNDKLPRGRKVFKYALTVVDMASRYKEAEPLTLKNSDEFAVAFHKIYKRSPLE